MAPKVLNSNGTDPTRDVVLGYIRDIDELNRQASSIQGKKTALFKRAADDGVTKKALMAVMKERNDLANNRDKYERTLNLYRKYLGFPEVANLPPRPEFHDEVDLSEEDRQKKWEEDGYVAGKLGKNRDVCPHEDPNSMGARYWMAGYDRGQKENAPKKKKPEPVVATGATGATAAPGPEGAAVGPQDEPEVKAAKAKRKNGVTYWHNPETKKVYELTIADATPEGAKPITRTEYDKLKAEYDKAEEDEWSAGSTEHRDEDEEKSGEDDDFGDDPEPAPPGAKLN